MRVSIKPMRHVGAGDKNLKIHHCIETPQLIPPPHRPHGGFLPSVVVLQMQLRRWYAPDAEQRRESDHSHDNHMTVRP
jgi:hypothetical protein